VKEILIVNLDTFVKTKNVLKPQIRVIQTLVVLEQFAHLRASQALLASVLQVHLVIPKSHVLKENVKEMKIVQILKLVKITTVSILAKLELAKRTTSAKLSDMYLLVVDNLFPQNKSPEKLL